ncbi:EndoU domain-containing protein [Chamaesiphon sp.]|uniref:EndoU domain-containing protein n=1 Tax=Chamaesiphon sp. TaxID=2814140 RepID=UPI003593B4D2
MEKPRRRRKQLPPFFDLADNPEILHSSQEIAIDLTPPPPDLLPFDWGILEVCGNLGDRVLAEDFQALLLAYPRVFHLIKTAVGGEIFRGRTTDAEFLADLTEIWFKRDGFEHIFCGNIHNGKLKGMHYVGRYLQLQERGLAGKLPNNHQQEETIAGAVYTIGVMVKYGDRFIVDRRNGYALITDAAELLIAATLAFKARAKPRTVCTFPVVDVETGQAYSAVLIKEDNAIVTFYPDVTPTNSPC